jgi:hypothetical protein
MPETQINNIPHDAIVYTKVDESIDPPAKVKDGVVKEKVLLLVDKVVLYVPVTYTTNTTISNTVLPTPPLWFNEIAEGSTLIWTNSSVVSATATYFVPYQPGVTQADYASITSNAKASVTAMIKPLELAAASSAASSAASNTSTPMGSTSGSCNFDHLSKSNDTSLSTALALASSSARKDALGSSAAVGRAVGGSIGGLLVGIAIALIALACLKRRKSHSSEQHPRRSRSSDGDADTRGCPLGKETQAFATATTVTGWQKHLPQEKDDGTITRAVKTIFDQIQMHVEGFYNSKPCKLSGSAASALERVSPDGLSRKLSKAPSSLPILEGILIRWIVHRISLRSDAGESFLPSEYTKIPEQNNWHMESEEGYGRQTEGPKKGQSSLAKDSPPT